MPAPTSAVPLRRPIGPWVGLMAVLLLVAGVMTSGVQRLHQNALKVERDRLAHQTKNLEERLAIHLQAVSNALDSLREPLSSERPFARVEQALVERLNALVAAMPFVRTLVVVDADGNVLASNQPALRGRNFRGSERYDTLSRDADPDTLYVSPPFQTVLNNFSYSLGKVIRTPQRKFAGYVLAIPDPYFMGLLMDAAMYAPAMKGALVHGDGQLVIGLPELENAGEGRDARFDGLLTRYLRSGQRAAVVTEATAAGGGEVLAAFATVRPRVTAADKPLILLLMRDRQAIEQPVRQEAVFQLGALGVLVVLASVALYLLQSRRLAELRAERAHREEQAEAYQQTVLSKERLKLALEAAGLATFHWDLQAGELVWSQAFRELWGFSADVGGAYETWVNSLHPDDRAAAERQVQQAMRSGSLFDTEYRIIRPDGSERWVCAKGRFFYDDGRPLRMEGVAADITQRKSAEAELSRYRNQLEQLVDDRTLALSQALQRLSQAESMAKAGAYDWNIHTNETTWSEGFYRIFGLDRATTVASYDCWRRALHPEDRDKTEERLREACARGDQYHQQYRVIWPDGTIRWIEGQGNFIVDAAGVPERLVGFCIDITERKAAEEALLRSETQFRSLYESMDEGVAIYRMLYDDKHVPCDYVVTGANPAFERETGLRREDVVGRKASEIFPSGPPIYLEQCAAVVRTGVAIRFEDYLAPLGRFLLLSLCKLSEDQFFAVISDVSERVAAERRLRENMALLQVAQNAADIGVWSWEIDSGKLDWDERLMAWYEVPEAVRASGLFYAFWTQRVHPDDAAKAEAVLRAAVQENKPYESEFRLLLPGGRVRHIHTSGVVECDGRGKPWRVVGVNRDVTAQRLYEARLEAANAAKSEFLANIGHEIRTPMNSIIGFTELTLEGELSEPQRRNLTTVRAAARSLLHLINDLLDLSKIEAGQLQVNRAPFLLQTVLDEVQDLFALSLQQKGLRFGMSIAAGLPEWFSADDLRLRQVLVNLMGNAVKFTEHGEIHLDVGMDPSPHPRPRLRFALHDTGIGIAPGQTEHLFERFTQADGSTTRRYGGTGLGLAISRRLVELMGGSIEVDSQMGQGTTFVFTIEADPVPGGEGLPVTAPAAGVEPPAADDGDGAAAAITGLPPDTVDRAALLARLARLDEQLANGQYAARQASAEIDILLKAGPLAASYQPIHAAVVELRFEAARAALSRLMALLKNE